jgi:signal transduction histidine kinase
LEGYQTVFQRILAGSETCVYAEWPLRTQHGKQIILALNIIPLRSRNGEINAVAGLGAEITEQTRIEQDRERRMQEMATLQQAGRFTTSIPHLDQALTGIVSAARLLLGSQTAMILLHDGANQELVVAALDGNLTLNSNQSPKSYILSRGDRMPEMAGVAGWVLRQRQPVLVADLSKEIDFEIVSDTSLRSFMAVPMIYQNRVIGVFEVNNSTQRAFTKQDLPLISMLADFATMAVINTQLFDSELEQHRLLEESQNRLIQSEKMNAMGRLISILAHEINNPLQSLRSGISLLREQPLSEQKKQSYLEMIYREVERLNRTVNQVLGFYRSPGLEPSPVSLNQMLTETLNLIEKQLEQNKITVCCDFDPHLPQITGLPDQLRQVFLNLILNAVEAMPGGGQLTLKTDQDDAAGVVRAAVQDNGVGIAPADLEKIFEPFYTTRPDGSGLGLSISYNLIEKHQGSLIVSSMPQAGTTFTVTLPIQPVFSTSE